MAKKRKQSSSGKSKGASGSRGRRPHEGHPRQTGNAEEAPPRQDEAPLSDRAEVRTHGTVEGLLSLIPGPDPSRSRGDPFLVLPGRATKAWLALFSHARRHGTWRPRRPDPLRPELTEGQFELTAHWTVNGLAYAMGVNRDTAGKALKELTEGGWLRREDPRNKGQFGGIDYSLTVPTTISQADRFKVADSLKKRGIEYRGYEYRTAARVLEDNEITRVKKDVELEIATEQADLQGDEHQAAELTAERVLRRVGKEKEPPADK